MFILFLALIFSSNSYLRECAMHHRQKAEQLQKHFLCQFIECKSVKYFQDRRFLCTIYLKYKFLQRTEVTMNYRARMINSHWSYSGNVLCLVVKFTVAWICVGSCLPLTSHQHKVVLPQRSRFKKLEKKKQKTNQKNITEAKTCCVLFVASFRALKLILLFFFAVVTHTPETSQLVL